MDLKKLSTGESVIAGSGLLLLIFSFFKWYSFGGGSVDVGGTSIDLDLPGGSLNGWQAPSSFLSIVAILIGVAAAGYVIATKLGGVDLPAKLGGTGMGLILLVAGAVAFVFLAIKYLSNTEGPEKFGFYISILASIGLAVGGFLTAKERGELPTKLGGSGSASPPTA